MKLENAFPYTAFKKSLLVMVIALTGCNDNSSDENTHISQPKFDAADCFNSTFAQAGTTSELTYDSTYYGFPQNTLTGSSPTISQQITKTIKSINLGSTTLNGQQASHIKEISTNGMSTITRNSYLQFNTGINQSILNVGFEEKAVLDSHDFLLISISQTNTPGSLLRYNLNQGDSYTDNYKFHTSIEAFNSCPITAPADIVCAAWVSSSEDISGTQSVKTTYLGKKSITIPAGTFTACEFQKEENKKLDTGEITSTSSTSWYAVDSGVLVKSNAALNADAINTLTLKSAKINGVPVVIK